MTVFNNNFYHIIYYLIYYAINRFDKINKLKFYSTNMYYSFRYDLFWILNMGVFAIYIILTRKVYLFLFIIYLFLMFIPINLLVIHSLSIHLLILFTLVISISMAYPYINHSQLENS